MVQKCDDKEIVDKELMGFVSLSLSKAISLKYKTAVKFTAVF
jgi:hypothetical protein